MPRLIFIATDQEKALWAQAAHGELVSLSEWLRRAANSRAGEKTLPRVAPAAPAPPAAPRALASSIHPGEEKKAVSPRPLLEHRADPKDKASQEHAPKGKTKATRMCEHRVPLGTFCKRCEDG